MLDSRQIGVNIELAQSFRSGAMTEYDKLGLGEETAKEAGAAVQITGENLMLIGAPGGFKTSFGSESHRTVEGIEEGNVVKIPPHAGTRDIQLVGGESQYTSMITNGGDETRSETVTRAVKALIHGDTQTLWIDEMTRQNQRALNAILPVFEEGVLQTSAGTVGLPGLEYGIAALNPSERRHITYPLAVAMAGRFGAGVMVGLRDGEGGAHKEHMLALAEKRWRYRPEEIEPVINLEDLHLLREHVEATPLSHEVAVLAVDATDKLLDLLEVDEYDAEEAWGRPIVRITRLALALGLLRGADPADGKSSGAVSEKDVYDAIRLRATAMVGGLSVHKSSRKIDEEIDSIMSDIFKS